MSTQHLALTQNASSLTMDISITHPCCQAYLAAAAEVPGSAAERRAKQKMDKYGDAATTVGMEFLPVILETYGRPNQQFSKWIVDVAKKKDKEHRRSKHKDEHGKIFMFGSWWFKRISIALQVGNAKIMLERAQRDADQPQA